MKSGEPELAYTSTRRDEDSSLAIQDITGNVVTSPHHNLNTGDYIIISGVNGAVGSQVNNAIFSVDVPDTDTFELNPPITADTYEGGGLITRMYVPFIQTKQFPLDWANGKKTRIGPQKYLLTKTANGQISVQLYLSQDAATPYNDPPYYPDVNADNNGLIFTQVVYTCPESTNLGLSPLNTNLQQLISPGSAANQPASSGSARIWHRMNTSLIGDTVQLGFTLSDEQMRDTTLSNQFTEIELHGFIMDISSAGDIA